MDGKWKRCADPRHSLARRGAHQVTNVYAFILFRKASYVTGALWLVDDWHYRFMRELSVLKHRSGSVQDKGRVHDHSKRAENKDTQTIK